MAEEKLYYTFEQDTRSFIHQINELLIRLENGGYNKDVVNQIFRCIHSIKSEAAYLKLDDIAASAHEMETVIEPLRSEPGATSIDSGFLEFCFAVIDGISKRVADIKIPRTVETDVTEAVSDDLHASLESVTSGHYTEFELLLIKEARSRGEQLYRLVFSISDEENMIYPRAYLALSNLEMNHNVITVKPDIEDLDKTGVRRVTVILSSFSSDNEIADEINIDQIENIEVSQLSFEKELSNLPEEEAGTQEGNGPGHKRVISVEASEIDAISEYVSQIKSRLADLNSVINEENSKDKLEFDIKGLETISSGIEKMMSNLQTVDLSVHFAGYRRTARDLASRLGKKVELEFDPGNIKILRDLAGFIAEPLLQLIRNAVVHGIEIPEQRIASGKPETGLIRIRAEKVEQSLIISVTDDGGGITLKTGDDTSLLNIISHPGFSTHGESSDYAGRGVGLDLVRSRVTERNGKLELQNVPGGGCTFRMIFNEGKMEIPFLVVRIDDKTFAVRTHGTETVISINAEDLKKIDGDYCFGENLLFTPDGRLRDLKGKSGFQALKLSHLGKSGMLVFDESLFEMHYKPEAVTEGFDIGSYCRELIINGKKSEYCLITPQVLFD